MHLRPAPHCGQQFAAAWASVLLAVGVLLLAALPALANITATDVTGRTVVLKQPATHMLIDDGRYLIALSLIHPDPVSVLSAWPKDINRIGPAVYAQYVEKFPAIERLKVTASSAGNFSVEQVLAAEPDLAIFSLTSKPSEEQIAQIEAAGIPVAIIDFFDQPLQNLEPSLRFLGAVTGRGEQAEAFIAFRHERMQAIADKLSTAGGVRPRVLLEPHAARTEECCASPGKGNIGNYIELAGGENIGSAVIPGVTGMLNLEYVIEADPDIYIATGGPHMEGTNGLLIGPGYAEATVASTLERVASRNGISGLKAVREGRVHGISHQLLNSPLDILTIGALAKWIRPDVFANIDLEATRNTINERFLAVPLTGINWFDLK
jgi:iron complex transport system substrate-binding protein